MQQHVRRCLWIDKTHPPPGELVAKCWRLLLWRYVTVALVNAVATVFASFSVHFCLNTESASASVARMLPLSRPSLESAQHHVCLSLAEPAQFLQ